MITETLSKGLYQWTQVTKFFKRTDNKQNTNDEHEIKRNGFTNVFTGLSYENYVQGS